MHVKVCTVLVLYCTAYLEIPHNLQYASDVLNRGTLTVHTMLTLCLYLGKVLISPDKYFLTASLSCAGMNVRNVNSMQNIATKLPVGQNTSTYKRENVQLYCTCMYMYNKQFPIKIGIL